MGVWRIGVFAKGQTLSASFLRFSCQQGYIALAFLRPKLFVKTRNKLFSPNPILYSQKAPIPSTQII